MSPLGCSHGPNLTFQACPQHRSATCGSALSSCLQMYKWQRRHEKQAHASALRGSSDQAPLRSTTAEAPNVLPRRRKRRMGLRQQRRQMRRCLGSQLARTRIFQIAQRIGQYPQLRGRVRGAGAGCLLSTLADDDGKGHKIYRLVQSSPPIDVI